jgi:nitrite reductase/ring-hydroxylating ferredoxin subunit
MANWIRVASKQECPAGQCREVVAGDRIVALCNVEGTFYALDGFCPHQGGSLGKGKLTGCTVTCPRHGLQMNVRTGAYAIGAPTHHPTFAVKVEGDDVFVDVEQVTQ